MGRVGYSFARFDVDKMARAMALELPVPTKKTMELVRAIRGMKVEEAEEYLEAVIAGKRPVPFKRYNRGVAAKRGTGPARFPKKSARHTLKVLRSASENARDHGLEPEEMRVKIAAASKGRTQKGFMPRARGRSTNWYHETVNVEIVLETMD